MLDTGAYIFNTEAHPFDAGALDCCHGPTDRDIWEKAWFPKDTPPTISAPSLKNNDTAGTAQDEAYCWWGGWKSAFGIEKRSSKSKPWSLERKRSPYYSLLTCDASQFLERFCISGEVCDL